MGDLERPAGIEYEDIHDAQGSFLQRWPFVLAALGLFLGAAFFGAYGAHARLLAAGDRVELTVAGPSRIRNGEFLEMIVTVTTDRDIGDLVILIDEPVWRDVTVNTLLPDPSEHGFRDGAFELRFGELQAGESLVVKIDAQINPAHTPSANRGQIAMADGDAVLATVAYTMEILP